MYVNTMKKNKQHVNGEKNILLSESYSSKASDMFVNYTEMWSVKREMSEAGMHWF